MGELAPSSARQIALRVKLLLSYGHRVGYLPFNAGAVIKAHAEARSVAQRIVSEVVIGLLVRSAPSRRDRILIEVVRVCELVALIWADVIERDGGKVQLSARQGPQAPGGLVARGGRSLTSPATR